MAVLSLESPFSFTADRSWAWLVSSATATEIVLGGGGYQQTYTGDFSYVDDTAIGTVTSVRLYSGGQLVYTLEGLHADAAYQQALLTYVGADQLAYADLLWADDTFTGSSGADVLLGYGGNDTISGGGGNDTVSGGDGTDVLVLPGTRAASTIVYSGSELGFTIATGQQDTLTVSNVESFRFDDQTVAADSLAVVPPSPDDFAATTATTGMLTVGASVNGRIEVSGDKDWFAIDLVAGQGYQLGLDGAASGGIGDPFLRLYDSGGTLLSSDDDSGPGLNALLTYGPSQTGTYYLESSGYSGTGDYVLGAQTAVLPDTTAPVLLDFNPADGGVNVAQAANITLTFSEAIKAGAGLIVLKTTDGATIESFDVQSSQRLTLAGTVLTIDPTDLLPAATYMEVTFDAGSILDTAGNAWVYSGRYDFRVAAPTTGPGSGAIVLVSSNTAGEIDNGGTNSASDSAPVTSADGQIVVFNSWGANLVAGDVNANHDTFVKYMNSGAVEYVVTDDLGTSPSKLEQYGAHFSISADGRYVAFETTATNLVPLYYMGNPDIPNGGTMNDTTITAGDNNLNTDVYVKDIFTGVIKLASSNAAGLSGKSGASGYVNSNPAMSADGSLAAFTSYNDELVAGDTNSAADIFIKNIQSGAITRVSTNAAGQQAVGGSSDDAVFSADGRYVVFESHASNLVTGDTNNATDIFRKDLQTGTVVRVSTNSAGEQTVLTSDTYCASVNAAVSANGRYVVFESDAKNLTTGDIGTSFDVFYKDLETGDLQRVAVNQAGLAATDASTQASISGDGRYVVFNSWDSNLVTLPFRHDSGPDVFIKDMQTGELRIVSAFPLDVAPYSLDGAISSDGRYVVLKSSYDPDYTIPGYQIYRLANPYLEKTSDASYVMEAQDVSLLLTGSAAVQGTGNAYGNVLTGNAANNSLVGGGGDDTLDGGAGADTAVFSGNRAEYVVTWDAPKVEFTVADQVAGRDGTDALRGMESLEFLDGVAAATTYLPGTPVNVLAYSWKNHTLLGDVTMHTVWDETPQTVATDAGGLAILDPVPGTAVTLNAMRTVPGAEQVATDGAVNLQDAIAILKMIVGLPVNGASQSLSPYQALAADFNSDGTVGLTDAIGVLKHVVGLSAPDPTWHFLNETDASIPATIALSPGLPQATVTADLSGTNPVHLGLVAYLSGDVDGSYAGAVGASDLDVTQPDYIATLVGNHTELSYFQFGM